MSKSRSKGHRHLEKELDRAFLIQDRWLRSILVPIVAGIGAALVLGRSPGSPLRELLIVLLFASFAAIAGLLVIWLAVSWSYRRKLNLFRSAWRLPAYGPHGRQRVAVYAVAMLASGTLGVLYFGSTSLRGWLWPTFVVYGTLFGGLLWLRNRNR